MRADGDAAGAAKMFFRCAAPAVQAVRLLCGGEPPPAALLRPRPTEPSYFFFTLLEILFCRCILNGLLKIL